MLDALILVAAAPNRFGNGQQSVTLEHYFQMARNSNEQTAMEMTKWFDTNYHYLVPEWSADLSFVPDTSKAVTDEHVYHCGRGTRRNRKLAQRKETGEARRICRASPVSLSFCKLAKEIQLTLPPLSDKVCTNPADPTAPFRLAIVPGPDSPISFAVCKRPARPKGYSDENSWSAIYCLPHKPSPAADLRMQEDGEHASTGKLLAACTRFHDTGSRRCGDSADF
jgi:hypothetical protein